MEEALVETYDRSMVEKLINISHEDLLPIIGEKIFTIKGENISIKQQTINIKSLCYQAIKDKNCQRRVKYKYAKFKDDGRLYSKSSSSQNILGSIRGLLTAKTAIDADAINCHPQLLLYICKKHMISSPTLELYCNNRNTYISGIHDTDDLEPKDAKLLFLKSMTTSWNIYKNGKTKIKNDFFLMFDREIKIIQNALKSLYPNEYEILANDSNQKGRFLSRILNIEEGQMLDSAYKCISKTHVVQSLCFDGLMLDKYNNGDLVDEKSVIRILEDATDLWQIKWKIKQPDMSLREWVENLSSTQSVCLYGNSETELVNEIFNYFYKDRLIKRFGKPYLLIDHKWIDNINTINDCIHRCVTKCKGYVERIDKLGMVSFELQTQQMIKATAIVKCILSLTPENPLLIDQVEQRSLGKIAFNNGYWDFKQKSFNLWRPSDDTINMINREFKYIPPHSNLRKQVFDRILNKMFCVDNMFQPEFHMMEHFLHLMGRVFCGIISDKIWFSVLGERDSSKGVFDTILRNAFGSYVSTFNSANFELEKNQADIELKLKFLLKNRHSRISVSQEISDRWLDGNILKKTSSGGDTITARNLYGHAETFQNCCKYMFFGNGVPRCKPVDTISTRYFLELKCKFVDNPDGMENISGIKYYKADPDIKIKFCVQEDILNAFCSIIFDYFTRTDTKQPSEFQIEDDVNIDPTAECNRLFEFSPEFDQMVSNEILARIFQENKGSFDNLIHLKRICKRLGAKDYRASVRGLKGLEVRCLEE